jgi:phage baseplate assembly protein gpV
MVKDMVLPYQLTDGALFNYGSDSHDFSVAGSTGQEATMYDGRIAINFIKNSHYDIVIGPNQTKVEALASLMAAEIN